MTFPYYYMESLDLNIKHAQDSDALELAMCHFQNVITLETNNQDSF